MSAPITSDVNGAHIQGPMNFFEVPVVTITNPGGEIGVMVVRSPSMIPEEPQATIQLVVVNGDQREACIGAILRPQDAARLGLLLCDLAVDEHKRAASCQACGNA